MGTDAELLTTMPLHAITATYGEAGLRERFALEIRPFRAAERLRLERALELAGRLHAADRRPGEPYLNHLLRVAIRIIHHYRVKDADVVCAALLHDAVEDHPAELAGGGSQQAGGSRRAQRAATGEEDSAAGRQQAALDVLAALFGSRVAELVGAVTNPEYPPGCDRHEQYREHVAASLARCPWARVIKASDFADNGAALIYYQGPRLAELVDKYAPLVPVLRGFITEPGTPLGDDARKRILDQLDRAAERFAHGPEAAT